MPDRTVVEGAQGNFPFERALFARPLPPDVLGPILLSTFGAPWIKPDPLASSESMTPEQIAAASAAIPAGVIGRQGTSLLYPVQTPDLIGVRDRRYLDHTGLQRHRSIADLMRYAAINRARMPWPATRDSYRQELRRGSKTCPARRHNGVTATSSFTPWRYTFTHSSRRPIRTSLALSSRMGRKCSSAKAVGIATPLRFTPTIADPR